MSSIAAAWKPWATKTSWAARNNCSRRAPRGSRDVRRPGTGADRGGCMRNRMLPASLPSARWTVTVEPMSDVPVPAVPGPTSPARAAVASATPLPSSAAPLPAWPGESLPVRGGEVFVRRTPWAGVEGSPRERALYVHGLGGASTNWTDLAGLLAVRLDGWALDLPGFGRSQPPRRARYSVQGHVRAVIDVLEHVRDQPGDAAGRPVHLVGNSLG